MIGLDSYINPIYSLCTVAPSKSSAIGATLCFGEHNARGYDLAYTIGVGAIKSLSLSRCEALRGLALDRLLALKRE